MSQKKPEEMTFEEQVQYWLYLCRQMIGEEIYEGGSIPGKRPPFPSIVCTAKNIYDYAHSMGDDNPLYTDPEYAAKTRYKCRIAPLTILQAVRYSAGHGPREDVKVFTSGAGQNNYFSGTMFEGFAPFYVGTRFFTSLRNREVITKKGAKGQLNFLVCEGMMWNQRGDLIGKTRGHIIFVPNSNRRNVERMGEEMLYERPTQSYTKEEVDAIVNDVKGETRRGAEPRYWEDVNVGDKLPTVCKPPFSCQDQTGFNAVRSIELREEEELWEMMYNHMREMGETSIHPVHRWPWTTRDEHSDPLACRLRGLPGPFDMGAQRCAEPAHILMNWGGDDCFIRKVYTEVRKPRYYGDTTWATGEIVNKYKVVEKGEEGAGGFPGEAEYTAVDIKLAQLNQIGENNGPGFATVYLPSREHGPVRLPIPHMCRPPGDEIYREPTPEYIPFPLFKQTDPKNWRVT